MPVSSQHAEYQNMLSKWQRCRDVRDGQDAIHTAGEKYLPKLKDQSVEAYRAMVLRATFYNATWRTIAGLVGMLFRKPPVVGVPTAIEDLMDDINAGGQPFSTFLQGVCEEGLTYGRVGVLIDYPQAPAGVTLADAQAMNLRPMMLMYNTFAIINWRSGRINNQTVLTFLVLEEQHEEADPGDEFHAISETRWRVLDLIDAPTAVGEVQKAMQYRQRIYRKKAAPDKKNTALTQADFERIGDDVIPLMGNQPLPYIPFVLMGVDDISQDVDDPPLIDLVNMNLSHYRTSADYAHGCHFTGLPTLFLAGIKKERPTDKIYVGSEAAITTPNENAKASFIEFTGEGLGSLVKKLDREEQQMAVLGARMLEPQRRGVEAPEAAAIHRKGEESMLSAVAQSLSLGMTQALKWFTEWAGQASDSVRVELNRDFYPAPMDPAMLTALLSGWQQGAPGLSDQGLFAALQAGEIVGEKVTLEEEQARIADRQQQIADQNAAAMAAQAAVGGPDAGPPA